MSAENNYSIVPFRQNLDPSFSWAMPYVTGHKYKIHWSNGIDFSTMQCDLSPKWTSTDKNLYIILYTNDVKAAINVTYDGRAASRIKNNSLTNASTWEAGDHVFYNETFSKYYKQFHFVINGKAMPAKSRLYFAS
jgi:hypothetical protein